MQFGEERRWRGFASPRERGWRRFVFPRERFRGTSASVPGIFQGEEREGTAVLILYSIAKDDISVIGLIKI